MAIKNGVPTECRFFGVKTAEKLTEKHGLAKIIIARNVIPHVANTHDFIEGMAKSITDRKSTRLNSSHQIISYAVFCLKKKTKKINTGKARIRQHLQQRLR